MLILTTWPSDELHGSPGSHANYRCALRDTYPEGAVPVPRSLRKGLLIFATARSQSRLLVCVTRADKISWKLHNCFYFRSHVIWWLSLSRGCDRIDWGELSARSDGQIVVKSSDTNAQVKDSYLITPETLIKAKPSMVVMHPLPRVNEIRYVTLHNAYIHYT